MAESARAPVDGGAWRRRCEESGAVEGAGGVWWTGEPSMCRTVVVVEARRVGSHGWGVMASTGTVKLVGA